MTFQRAMQMSWISRREFLALTAGAAAAGAAFDRRVAGAGAGPTAQEIVDRIRKNLGVDWSSNTVDTFKIGDPATVVTGVVTTSMATLDVLQKAVKSGANLVITAAPTFYSSADLSTPVVATADYGYLRLRREDYTDADMTRWAEAIKEKATVWPDVFVYLKHEESGMGPKLATQLRELLGNIVS